MLSWSYSFGSVPHKGLTLNNVVDCNNKFDSPPKVNPLLRHSLIPTLR